RIGEQPPYVVLGEGRDRRDGEAGEGGAEVLPLAQDHQPRQPRLEALQGQPLEDPVVSPDRPSPLLVVVGDIVGRGGGPGAADPPVRPGRVRHSGSLAGGWSTIASRSPSGPSAEPKGAG